MNNFCIHGFSSFVKFSIEILSISRMSNFNFMYNFSMRDAAGAPATS